MQLNNYTCVVSHKKGELHLYIMNFCFATLITFFKQHHICNDIPSIKMCCLLMWTLKKANLNWHYLESPENSILNFHNSWIWIFQFLQGLQVPSNYTSLSRQNKQYRIFCFQHCFHLTPNSSTPVDAPATWELLQIHTPSVSDSSHPPLPVTHTDTHPSLFIFQRSR